MVHKIHFNDKQQKLINNIFIKDLLENANRFLDKNNRLAKRLIIKVLEIDPDNVEAKKLLENCKEKLDKNKDIFVLITNFIKGFYPIELKTFKTYWDNLSANEKFMKGKRWSAPEFGWAFTESKDLSLTIFEIIVHLLNKGVLEKSSWSKANFEKWLKKEIKKKGGDKELQESLFEYFQNILICEEDLPYFK